MLSKITVMNRKYVFVVSAFSCLLLVWTILGNYLFGNNSLRVATGGQGVLEVPLRFEVFRKDGGSAIDFVRAGTPIPFEFSQRSLLENGEEFVSATLSCFMDGERCVCRLEVAEHVDKTADPVISEFEPHIGLRLSSRRGRVLVTAD